MYKKLLISICLAAMVSSCQQPPEDVAAPRPVWVMSVGSGDAFAESAFTGEVKSRYESNIGFRVAGKITARAVNVGELVKKGQLIAQLDPSDSLLNEKSAYAEVQTAQANLTLAQAELARRQQLYIQKFISKSALDSYETQVKTSQARLEQAKAQAAMSRQQAGYTKLMADRAGVIGMIQAEPGQVVAAGQTIAQIYDVQKMEVMIAVPESMIDRFRVGDTAHVSLKDVPQTYKGRIREISPAANSQTHAFDLRIELQNSDQLIKLGMTAQVSFEQDDALKKIIVPSTAVTRHGNDVSVWVIDANNQAHLRKVTTGKLSEDGIEINSGLKEQERIAIIGVHTLTEGMKVQPVKPELEVLR